MVTKKVAAKPAAKKPAKPAAENSRKKPEIPEPIAQQSGGDSHGRGHH